MLNDEDAIDYVAHKMMRADWEYDRAKRTKPSTWRCLRGRKAIQRYIFNWYKAGRDGPMRRRPLSLDEFGPGDAHCLCRDDGPPREEDREHVTSRLGDLLANLTPCQRDCITLSFIDGRSPPEIARTMGISRQSVQKTIDRALRILREKARDGDGT